MGQSRQTIKIIHSQFRWNPKKILPYFKILKQPNRNRIEWG